MAFSWIAFVPGKIALFLHLGLLPFVNYLVPKEYALSVTRCGGALACGIANTACLLTAGVSGPILNVFYINSGLTRQQIIATKGFTQTTGHLFKIFYFGTFLGLPAMSPCICHYGYLPPPWRWRSSASGGTHCR